MSLYAAKSQNFLKNPNFNIWQRGTSFPSMANGTKMWDRWAFGKQGAAVMTCSQTSQLPSRKIGGNSFSNAIFSAGFSVDTAEATNANQADYITTTIEGFDWQYLFGNWFTFSFWVKFSKVGTYSISFRNSGGFPDAVYTTSFTVNTASVWEKKVITVPPYTGGTEWLLDNGVGLVIIIAFSAGTSFQTASPNKWYNPGLVNTTVAVSGQTNGVDSTSNLFFFSAFKLEIGQTASPLDYIPINDDLKDCRRYYYRLTAGGGGGQLYLPLGFAKTTSNVNAFMQFPVPMRSQPTVSKSSAAHFTLIDTSGASITPSDVNGSALNDYDNSGLGSEEVGCGGMVVTYVTAALFTANRIHVPIITTNGGWIAFDGEF